MTLWRRKQKRREPVDERLDSAQEQLRCLTERVDKARTAMGPEVQRNHLAERWRLALNA